MDMTELQIMQEENVQVKGRNSDLSFSYKAQTPCLVSADSSFIDNKQNEWRKRTIFRSLRSIEFDCDYDHARMYSFVEDSNHDYTVTLCQDSDMKIKIDLMDPQLEKIYTPVECQYLKMIYRIKTVYSQKIPWHDERVDMMKRPEYRVNLNAFTLALETFSRELEELIKFTKSIL